MSLNPHVKGEKHGSGGKGSGKDECVAAFKSEDLRTRMTEASPEVAMLVRLFKVAEEVNRHQMSELRSCHPAFDSKVRAKEESSIPTTK